MRKTVSILGTDYEVLTGVDPAEDAGLEGRMGYCIPTSAKIVVADMKKIDGWRDEEEQARENVTATTLRHEVLHAFLAESGLWSNSLDTGAWSMNEEMIDWFAMQWPKISSVFHQLGCGGRFFGKV